MMARSATRLTPGQVLAFGGLAMPPLSAIAPLAIAPLLGLLAVAVLASGGHRNLHHLARVKTFATILALLCLWATASALWSILPLHSFLEGLRLLSMSFAGLVMIAAALGLDEPERERMCRWTLGGLVVALILLALFAGANALLAPFPPDVRVWRWLERLARFDRGATTVALVVWSVSFGLIGSGRGMLAGVLLGLTLGVALALASQAAMLCIVMGLILLPMALMLPRLTVAAIGAGLVAVVVLLPISAPDMALIARIHHTAPWLKGSAIHRLAIWNFAADRIADRPVLGWGLDASRALPGGDVLIDDPRLPELARAGGQWMPLHPHSAALQWRLELGIPGAALCTLVVLWVISRLGSAAAGPRATQAIATALTGATLVVALLSYGFWQAWWQSSIWLIATLTLAMPLARRTS